MRARLLIIAGLLYPAGFLRAELIEVQHLKVRNFGKQERFAMLVTPDQDLLLFGAKPDGAWTLTRIHGWADKGPVQETISVPGVSWTQGKRGEYPELVNISPEVFVTPDGRFAVCVAAAFWRQSGARGSGTSDDIVSVIDLGSFVLIRTIQPPVPIEGTKEWKMDQAGNLVLEAEPSLSDGSVTDVDLLLFALPDLRILDRCHYQRVPTGGVEPLRSDPQRGCATLLRESRTGAGSLQTYFDSIPDQTGYLKRRSIADRFLIGSPDGRFVLERFHGGLHVNLLGRVAADEGWDNVILVDPRRPVGELSSKTRAQFAAVNGLDYLLVMKNSSDVTVYEVTDKQVVVRTWVN